VLRLVIAGNTNREIAEGLFIAEVTVKKTVTSIYRKLHVNGRAAAVRKALELGLILNANQKKCILSDSIDFSKTPAML
jgi:LuxR family transcriptional regulator, maltose regulon positive regulatory protein